MGLGFSKDKDAQEEEDAKFVNDPSLIFWDESGNIRYGKAHPVKREKQIREIMALDHIDDEPGIKTWYVVESAWIASWLAYVHFDQAFAPNPGPCRNERLIVYNYEQGKWTGRFGLFMAVKDRAGDYRRVSKETWDKFCQFYPGSGPTISFELDNEKLNDNGIYDCVALFNIHDPPPAPADKNKKLKKRMFGKFKTKQEKEAEKVLGISSPTTSIGGGDNGDTQQQQQQPVEESKQDELISSLGKGTPIPINSNTSSNTSTSIQRDNKQFVAGSPSGSGYEQMVDKNKKQRGSLSSQDGLMADSSENEIRPSTMAGGRRDSYIEGVFFGKD